MATRTQTLVTTIGGVSMREIVFRGKRVDNGEWVYGDFLSRKNKLSTRPYIVFHDSEYIIPRTIEVDPDTVSQWTGLTAYIDTDEEYEMEEMKLFEGDILEFAVFDHNDIDTHYTGIIKYADGMYQIWKSEESEYFGHNGGFVLGWVLAQDDESRIIGNIHDNPELMEE